MSDPDDEENDKEDPEGDEEIESTEAEAADLDEDFSEDLEVEEEFADEEADEDLKVVDEALTHRDQNARALAIRRAIEERLEAKRLSKDLDYLDLDPDSDD